MIDARGALAAWAGAELDGDSAFALAPVAEGAALLVDAPSLVDVSVSGHEVGGDLAFASGAEEGGPAAEIVVGVLGPGGVAGVEAGAIEGLDLRGGEAGRAQALGDLLLAAYAEGDEAHRGVEVVAGLGEDLACFDAVALCDLEVLQVAVLHPVGRVGVRTYGDREEVRVREHRVIEVGDVGDDAGRRGEDRLTVLGHEGEEAGVEGSSALGEELKGGDTGPLFLLRAIRDLGAEEARGQIEDGLRKDGRCGVGRRGAGVDGAVDVR